MYSPHSVLAGLPAIPSLKWQAKFVVFERVSQVKILLILFLSLSVSSVMAQGKGKDSQLERELKDEVRNELLDIDDDRGSGKPGNPGAQGRANAEYKKATNPGQGGGKNGSLEGAIVDELLDDDDRGGNKGGKNKDGKKNK
jgi:hypothetical protein